MRKLYGEALTLRAQFYYEAIRNWGDLPAHFVPAADLPDTYLPKTDRDTIYDHLLDDLAMAAEFVPWRSQAGAPSTRITKGVVKGLRARIALARGGYSLRRDTRKNERRADYKKYYQIALDETKAIIDSREHGLNPVYENIFKTLHSGNRQDPSNELMFEVGAYGGNASTDSKLGYYNGLRVNTSAKFGGGGGGIVALPTYFYEFAPEDVRRDVTINIYEIDANSRKVLVAANNFSDGKFRRPWTNITGTSQNLAINWPILRYADVLLMYAEADNEINGAPSAAAIEAFEQVRKRAFTGNPDKMGATPTDYTGFFNAIVQERLLEFGGEGIRKYDLIRWNLLGTKINETRDKLRQFMNGQGAYANLPAYVYAKPADYNIVASQQEVATLDLSGGAPDKVLFEPGQGTSTAPAGYTTKNWRAAVNEDFLTGDLNGYARYFEANRKELFPIYSGHLNANFRLTQDYGY
jgi:starch-binding outer membrane protein, SusD/RagB family